MSFCPGPGCTHPSHAQAYDFGFHPGAKKTLAAKISGGKIETFPVIEPVAEAVAAWRRFCASPIPNREEKQRAKKLHRDSLHRRRG